MPLYNPIPAGTTTTAGELELDGTASDIQPVDVTAAAGSSSKAAPADHVHPNSVATQYTQRIFAA